MMGVDIVDKRSSEGSGRDNEHDHVGDEKRRLSAQSDDPYRCGLTTARPPPPRFPASEMHRGVELSVSTTTTTTTSSDGRKPISQRDGSSPLAKRSARSASTGYLGSIMSRINTVDNGLEGLGFRIPNVAHIPTSSRRGVDHLAVPSTDNEAETFFNNILDRLVAAEDICSEVTNEKSQEMRTSAETADKQSHQLPTRKPSPEVGDRNRLPSAAHAPPAKKESAKVCAEDLVKTLRQFLEGMVHPCRTSRLLQQLIAQMESRDGLPGAGSITSVSCNSEDTSTDIEFQSDVKKQRLSDRSGSARSPSCGLAKTMQLPHKEMIEIIQQKESLIDLIGNLQRLKQSLLSGGHCSHSVDSTATLRAIEEGADMQEVVDSALSELSDSLTTKGSSPPPCVDMDDLMQQTNYICSKNAAKQQTLPPHISQSLSPDLLQAAERALMHPSADDIYGTDHLPAFGLDVDTTHSDAMPNIPCSEATGFDAALAWISDVDLCDIDGDIDALSIEQLARSP